LPQTVNTWQVLLWQNSPFTFSTIHAQLQRRFDCWRQRDTYDAHTAMHAVRKMLKKVDAKLDKDVGRQFRDRFDRLVKKTDIAHYY
jgi:hypothetical protein